jgi:hypothetical protein
MFSLRPTQVDLHIFFKKNIHGWFFDRLEFIERLLVRMYYASKPTIGEEEQVFVKLNTKIELHLSKNHP